GMTAYVSVPIAEAQNVIKIPNGALRFQPDYSEDELKKIYAKYKIPNEETRGQGLAGTGGGQGGAGKAGGFGGGAGGGGRPAGGGDASGGGGGEQRRAFGGGGMGGGGAAGGMRRGPQIVWKLLPNKELQPVMVRLGVTDYTFTQLIAVVAGGEIKPGDELVIGQSVSGQAQAVTGQRPGAPGASPVGGPGGFRRM
ncbi:MAG TPA: hypothetical protein VGQ11_02420, partial [Candidatus Acidoferrales bacterium]|nr:hypothetical protein [Candidatus Acidoferrales bacterium]